MFSIGNNSKKHFSLSRRMALLVLQMALLAPAGLMAQAKESVAVMDMEGRGISQSEAASLTDRLRSKLVSTGVVTVVERGAMQAILAEQDFQMSGCTSDECAVEVGQLLGVTMMIAGTVGKIGSTYTLDLRTIDIETGTIASTMTRDYRGEIDGLLIEIEYIAWELVGLVHPDQILGELRAEPSGITLDDFAGRRGNGGQGQATVSDGGKKKGGAGRLLLWTAILAVAGGGGYYALVLAPGGGGDIEAIDSPPEFPTVP
ncbi:MAG: DUF2380 domain-containing protein [Candidatus Marinimicrobia bacterium]|nr:DUF2380 domain-containing protein [Candidatus Neomarinimicrobiota bacterium]